MLVNRWVSYVDVVLSNFRPILSEILKGKKSQIGDRFVFLWMKKRIGLLCFVFFAIIFLLIGFNIRWEEKVVIAKEKQTIRKIEKIDPALFNVPYVKREWLRDLNDNIDDENEVEETVKKKARTDWINILSSKDKRLDEETRNFVRSKFSLMRYRCSAYFNQRVDVACRGKNNFCVVAFDFFLNQKKYRMKFKSFVSANGFDRVDWWEIFVWKKDNSKIVDKRKLVDGIVMAKPNCNPFNSE